MELQDIVNLIHLRKFLYEVQNGYSAVSKDQLKGINQKLRELDTVIIKNALTANLTKKTMVEYSSSDADFEESNRIVEEARKMAEIRKSISKAGVDIEKAAGGVTLATAPPDPVEAEDPATQVKAAPKKRKGAFNRTEE